MDNKFLCVMAGYDKNTELLFSNMQKDLYAKGFTGKQTKDIPQHITLGTYEVSRELEISNLVKAVVNQIKSFKITFNHIGIFGGSEVLFIAPDTNKDLLDLKEKFGSSYNWTPHSTLLIDKPEVICQAIPSVTSNFKAVEGYIEYIYLYEFWPTRFICSERLRLDKNLNT